MQKTIKYFLVVCAMSVSSYASAQNASVQNSVATVEQLLKADNGAALEGSRKSIAPASTASQPNTFKPVKAGNGVIVERITGVDGQYKISLTLNGMHIKEAGIGSKVGKCNIVRVEGRCVVMAPTVAESLKTGKSISKSNETGVSQCPAACWTGEGSLTPPVDAQRVVPGVAGGIVPTQSPMIPVVPPMNVGR